LPTVAVEITTPPEALAENRQGEGKAAMDRSQSSDGEVRGNRDRLIRPWPLSFTESRWIEEQVRVKAFTRQCDLNAEIGFRGDII